MIDASTLFAGPLAATMLGDLGAEVIKVEHPNRPDPSRGHGQAKHGQGLWWKMLGRNKRPVALDLKSEGGREAFLRLTDTADVLIENFRPGTLDRWGLDHARLTAANPGLVVARITGFGQFGPRASEPGFGTLAEAMSGFAAMTGQPDGPPTLPPLALADGITGLAAAYAIMTALWHRNDSGRGQEIDLSLIEPILTLLGPQPSIYDQLGEVYQRTGNRSANNSPRNTYRARDGRWVAVSTSSQSIAERVMQLVGAPQVIQEPWFASGRERAQHADELDALVGGWIAERDAEEVLRAFTEANAAATLVYDITDIMTDPQYAALDAITTLDDPDLGALKMQNVMFRMSQTPGRIDFAGRGHGADTDTVLGELGYSAAELQRLRDAGEIR